MTDSRIVRTVDHLHSLEGASLLQRLAESEAFVPGNMLEAHAALEAMIADEREHLRRLADLLDVLHATPGPRRFQLESGSFHFNRFAVLLPLLIADKERLIAAYEAAAPRVAPDARAADAISGILTRHQAHLARLRELHKSPAGKS